MIKSIGILLIAVAFVLIEVPPLLEKKLKKELLFFFLFLVVGVGMSMTLAFGKTIPTPLELLTYIFKPLNDIINR